MVPAEPRVQEPRAKPFLKGLLNGFQVWSLGQPTPNFTLEGHEKGVNAVDYFVGGMSQLPMTAAVVNELSRCGHPRQYHHLT